MNRSSLRRQYTYPLLIMAVILFALAAVALLNGNATAAAEGTTVSLEVPQGAAPGDLIEVKLVADNAENLGGFQAAVHYDPAQLRLTGARLPEQLGNSGRDLLALGPVFRSDSVVIGAASCPVQNCSEVQQGRAQQEAEGVNGRVELATLTFYVEQPGQYALHLQGVKLVDPQGATLSQSSLDAVLDVSVR
jgi:hypothetical protein